MRSQLFLNISLSFPFYSWRRILWITFQTWKKFAKFMKEERVREERREQLRKKVAEILPDFQVLAPPWLSCTSDQVLGPYVRGAHEPVQCLQWECPSVHVCYCHPPTHMRVHIPDLSHTSWIKLCCEFVLSSFISEIAHQFTKAFITQQDLPKEQSRASVFKCILYIFSIINFKKDKGLLAWACGGKCILIA